MKLKKIDLVIYAILAAVLVQIVWVYPALPARIPTHWGFSGQVDGWGDKWMIWVIYGLVWLMDATFCIAPKIDPKKDSYKKFAGSYETIRLFMAIFMLLLLEMIIKVSLDPNGVNVRQLFPVVVSASIIIIGNYLPKCKQNYTLGIKTPWTLASEAVWNQTHRFAGLLWVVLGTISLGIAIVTSGNKVFTAIGFIIAIVATVGPVVYSYIVFKKEKRQ